MNYKHTINKTNDDAYCMNPEKSTLHIVRLNDDRDVKLTVTDYSRHV